MMFCLARQENVDKVFDAIDQDRDGVVTRSDFIGAVKMDMSVDGKRESPPANLAQPSSHAISDEIDANHDGIITRSDFRSAVMMQTSVTSPKSSTTSSPKIQKVFPLGSGMVLDPINPVGFVQQARPFDPGSPSMASSKYTAAFSPQDLKHIIDQHEQKKTQEEEDRQKALKLLVESVVRSHVMVERVERENKIHSCMVVEQDERENKIQHLDFVISQKVNEAANKMNEFSSFCETRLKELEVRQAQHASLYHQLCLDVQRHQESLTLVESARTKWSAQHEEHSKHMSENFQDALVAVREDLNVLIHEHGTYVEQQKKYFDSFQNEQSAMRQEDEEAQSLRFRNLTRSIEEQYKTHKQEHAKLRDAIVELVRIEDHTTLGARVRMCATLEDVKQLEERMQLLAVPIHVYKSLEERLDAAVQSFTPLESHRHVEKWLQTLSTQTDQKLESILQSCTPFEAHRSLEDRLQSAAIDVLRNLEERLQLVTPRATHQALEERLHAFGIQTNQILDVILQSYTPLDAHRKLETRLDECVPLESHKSAQEKISDVEDRLAKLHDTHHESHDSSRQLHLQMCMKFDDYTQKHNDLCTLLESERDARAEDFSERDAQLEELGRRLEAESAERNVKYAELKLLLQELVGREGSSRTRELQTFAARLDAHSTSQDELATSHQQLLALHQELSVAHSEARKMHLQDCTQLVLRLERHDAEVTNCHSALEALEKLVTANRENNEKQWKVAESFTREMQNKFEAGLSAVQPLVDGFTSELESIHREFNDELVALRQKIDSTHDILNGEINTGFVGLRHQLDETKASLEASHLARQQQVTVEIQNVHERHESKLKEEASQRCAGIKQVLEKTSQIEAVCETLRSELTRECKSVHMEMERLMTEHEAASQQMTDVMSTMSVDNERIKREMNQGIDGLRSDFADERNRQSRLADEERGVFRKLHEEHVHCLDVERETRLRQATQLRADFVKAMTKERDLRVADSSEHRSEMSRVAREWQALKNKLATQSLLSSPLSSPRSSVKSPLCAA